MAQTRQKKNVLRVFEGFAGYGGASFGLKRAKKALTNFDYTVVGYSEFDKYASKLFDANHRDEKGNPIYDPDSAPVFDFSVPISASKNTDVGKLKALAFLDESMMITIGLDADNQFTAS